MIRVICFVLFAAILTSGCGGASIVLPETVWLKTSGEVDVAVGFDSVTAMSVHSDGSALISWEVGSWPPDVTTDGCVRLRYLFNSLSVGCEAADAGDASSVADPAATEGSGEGSGDE